jgi:gas vesicle protein
MLQTMQGSSLENQSAAGLETMRMQMFGRYYEELEGRMKELRQVLDGGVSRARKAMLERVDELGAALHRDMVSLRQEVQKELEDLKRDVFTTVMSVSAINDRMGMAESRNRETWMAVTKALTDRIEQQSNSCNEAIGNFRDSLDQSLEQRVVNTVESTLMRMAAARRGAETVAA